MSDRAGIILAGGSGTRLRPLTNIVSKQLLPVYDKPMVFYPLTTMLNAGINDIIVIVDCSSSLMDFRSVLGYGEKFGVKLDYAIQVQPNGIAEAYVLVDQWLNGRSSMLILGDNIFIDNISDSPHDTNFVNLCKVADPCSYGVAKFGEYRVLDRIIEKPVDPPSPWAVTGAYFLDGDAPKYARGLKKSDRHEFEITDLLNAYIKDDRKMICYNKLHRPWFDCGTFDRLLDASNYIAAAQRRTGEDIGNPFNTKLAKSVFS